MRGLPALNAAVALLLLLGLRSCSADNSGRTLSACIRTIAAKMNMDADLESDSFWLAARRRERRDGELFVKPNSFLVQLAERRGNFTLVKFAYRDNQDDRQNWNCSVLYKDYNRDIMATVEDEPRTLNNDNYWYIKTDYTGQKVDRYGSIWIGSDIGVADGVFAYYAGVQPTGPRPTPQSSGWSGPANGGARGQTHYVDRNRQDFGSDRDFTRSTWGTGHNHQQNTNGGGRGNDHPVYQSAREHPRTSRDQGQNRIRRRDAQELASHVLNAVFGPHRHGTHSTAFRADFPGAGQRVGNQHSQHNWYGGGRNADFDQYGAAAPVYQQAYVDPRRNAQAFSWGNSTRDRVSYSTPASHFLQMNNRGGHAVVDSSKPPVNLPGEIWMKIDNPLEALPLMSADGVRFETEGGGLMYTNGNERKVQLYLDESDMLAVAYVNRCYGARWVQLHCGRELAANHLRTLQTTVDFDPVEALVYFFEGKPLAKILGDVVWGNTDNPAYTQFANLRRDGRQLPPVRPDGAARQRHRSSSRHVAAA